MMTILKGVQKMTVLGPPLKTLVAVPSAPQFTVNKPLCKPYATPTPLLLFADILKAYPNAPEAAYTINILEACSRTYQVEIIHDEKQKYQMGDTFTALFRSDVTGGWLISGRKNPSDLYHELIHACFTELILADQGKIPQDAVGWGAYVLLQEVITHTSDAAYELKIKDTTSTQEILGYLSQHLVEYCDELQLDVKNPKGEVLTLLEMMRSQKCYDRALTYGDNIVKKYGFESLETVINALQLPSYDSKPQCNIF